MKDEYKKFFQKLRKQKICSLDWVQPLMEEFKLSYDEAKTIWLEYVNSF